MKIMYFSSASSSRQKLTYLLSALGVADGSYCLIQKNAVCSCPSLSHSTQIDAHHDPRARHRRSRPVHPPPISRPPHRDSDAPASTHAHRLPAHRALASAHPLRLGLRPLTHRTSASARPPWLLRPSRCQSSSLRFGHRSPILRHPRHQA
jgi:hypothetical protein